MLIQILLIIFSIFALSRVLYRYKKSGISGRETILWAIFWCIVIVVSLIPDVTSKIANFLGVGRGADLVVYVSLIILFFLLFKIFARLYRIEKDISKIIEHIAINKSKKQ